jgi:hypothetical protein
MSIENRTPSAVKVEEKTTCGAQYDALLNMYSEMREVLKEQQRKKNSGVGSSDSTSSLRRCPPLEQHPSDIRP